MKFLIVIAVVLFVAACLTNASPSAGEEDVKFVDGLDALQQLEPELHARHKRATCDLLSATGIRHTACAAHCLFRGNRGGYCNSRAICVCRN